jgi:hypothetical protein
MDPTSSYLLKIFHLGNPEKARKDVACFYFEKVVDCDTTNLKDFVDSITDKCPPSYGEISHVQYYDVVLKTYPVVTTDQQLMAMFERHSETKIIHMFFSYTDPSKLYEPITKWPEHCLPIMRVLTTVIYKTPFMHVDEEVMYLPSELMIMWSRK